MIDKQTTIYLYRGATSTVEFDFSEFVFDTNSKCVFTLTSLCGDKTLFQFEFNQSKKYIVVFEDNKTCDLINSKYKYNIMYIVGDERYPMCSDSEVIVSEVTNGYTKNNN